MKAKYAVFLIAIFCCLMLAAVYTRTKDIITELKKEQRINTNHYKKIPKTKEHYNWRSDIKVYMYPLDNKFNFDILYPYAGFFPQMEEHHALGNIVPEIGSEFVRTTDQFALEIYFYKRLLYSPYITHVYEEADIYYVPMFGNQVLINFQKDNSGKDHLILNKEFWKIMKNDTEILENPQKYFTIYGGCEQFAKRFKKEMIPKFTTVMIEREEKSDVIVAPYPAQIHFSEHGKYEIDFNKKDLLVSSAWHSRTELRNLLSILCIQNNHLCIHHEIEPSIGYSAIKKNATLQVYQLTSRSIFCLSPFGDSNSRKGFWDALLVGCINVIYKKFKLPFDDKIDYDQMTIYIPEENANETFAILQDIPKDKISAMQQYIDEKRVHLQYYLIPDKYENIPQEKDAFDMLLDELYQKITIK